MYNKNQITSQQECSSIPSLRSVKNVDVSLPVERSKADQTKTGRKL